MSETSLVTHFFNEEMMIGDWIEHHKKFFDRAVLINHHSTDNSVEIALSLIPDGWKVVNSELPDFNAVLNDREVQYHESTLSGWKMALNITEYLFCPNLKEKLAEWQTMHSAAVAFGSRAVVLVDQESLPLETPLWSNRQWGFLQYEPRTPLLRRWRYIHRADHGAYAVGRHSTSHHAVDIMEFLHLHFLYSPWPECLSRKLQIQNRIPACDRNSNLGAEHITTAEKLEILRKDVLLSCRDLKEYPDYKRCYEQLIKG